MDEEDDDMDDDMDTMTLRLKQKWKDLEWMKMCCSLQGQ